MAGATPAQAAAPTPTSVAVHSSSGGTYLTWTSGTSTGAIITQATNAALTVGRRDFDINGTTHTFTPYGMTTGRVYYYRVRSRVGSTASAYSAEVSTVVRSRAQAVRVMTYNVIEHAYDGDPEGGQTIAPWSQRRTVVASLIKEVRPDVLSVQEAESWMVTNTRGPRQIDDLAHLLGSPYRIARTEIPPTEAGYYRAGGNYIIYNSSAFEEIGHGNHWPLPYGKFAAYVILRNKISGACALFISTHFTVGNGATYDAQRETQMKSLMSLVATYRAALGNVPVIYAGDWNSTNSASHAFDGVAIAAAAGHLQNTRNISQTVTNSYYNSANQYLRTAAVGGYQIDKIYAPAGVASATWYEVLHLSGGKFVGVMGSDHNPIYSAMSYPY